MIKEIIKGIELATNKAKYKYFLLKTFGSCKVETSSDGVTRVWVSKENFKLEGDTYVFECPELDYQFEYNLKGEGNYNDILSRPLEFIFDDIGISEYGKRVCIRCGKSCFQDKQKVKIKIKGYMLSNLDIEAESDN